MLPQFQALFGTHDMTLGVFWALQVEIANSHVISLAGQWGAADGFIVGGGVGYSYELSFARDILRLEIAAHLGYFFW